MANRKRSGRPPQAQHAAKSKLSQHDKRQRLTKPNPKREATDAATIPLVGAYAAWTLVRPLIAEGAIVMTRLPHDAKLFDLPVNKTGQRSRPRKYGKNRISLTSG